MIFYRIKNSLSLSSMLFYQIIKSTMRRVLCADIVERPNHLARITPNLEFVGSFEGFTLVVYMFAVGGGCGTKIGMFEVCYHA